MTTIAAATTPNGLHAARCGLVTRVGRAGDSTRSAVTVVIGGIGAIVTERVSRTHVTTDPTWSRAYPGRVPACRHERRGLRFMATDVARSNDQDRTTPKRGMARPARCRAGR